MAGSAYLSVDPATPLSMDFPDETDDAQPMDDLMEMLFGADQARLEPQRARGPHQSFHARGLQSTTFEDLLAASQRLGRILDTPINRNKGKKKKGKRMSYQSNCSGADKSKDGRAADEVLSIYPWYIGEQGRSQAEALLTDRSPGTGLVRRSAVHFTLTVKGPTGACHHIQV